jgi:predicted nucleic acid-binding protein
MVLLDTNILLRQMNPDAPEHASVAAALRSLTEHAETVCICAQNIVELWAVLTRPTSANGMGLSPAETRRRIDAIMRLIPLIPDPPGLLAAWLDLCAAHDVRGRQVYDARLVALMHTASIASLVTLNPLDFARYRALNVIVPGSKRGHA